MSSAHAIGQSRVSAKVVGGFTLFFSIVLLIVREVYYLVNVGDPALDNIPIIGIGTILLGSLVLGALNETNESKWEAHVSTRGWQLIGGFAAATCTVFMLLFGPMSTGAVWVIGGQTSYTQSVFVAVPFVSSVNYVSKSYGFIGDQLEVSIPIDAHHRLVADVEASGFELDDSDVDLINRYLVDLSQDSPHPGSEIRNELAGLINDAVSQELKGWSLARLDATGRQFTLTNSIANRIIEQNLATRHLRWRDGKLSINAHLVFNS